MESKLNRVVMSSLNLGLVLLSPNKAQNMVCSEENYSTTTDAVDYFTSLANSETSIIAAALDLVRQR